jgi:hypothetical protein
MTKRTPTLTENDHINMDEFLAHLFDDYKNGSISKEKAVGAIAQVISAIDIGNYGEATNWFMQGRKLIRQSV